MICTQPKKIVKIYNFQTSSSLAELSPIQPQLVSLFPLFSWFFSSELRKVLDVILLLTQTDYDIYRHNFTNEMKNGKHSSLITKVTKKM